MALAGVGGGWGGWAVVLISGCSGIRETRHRGQCPSDSTAAVHLPEPNGESNLVFSLPKAAAQMRGYLIIGPERSGGHANLGASSDTIPEPLRDCSQ